LLELSKSKNFRTLVANDVALEFDDDTNSLLKKLSGLNSSTLPAQFSASIAYHTANSSAVLNQVPFQYYTNLQNIDQAINGMKLGCDSLFLQIYIPFFELYDPNKALTVVPVFSDDTSAVYKGFRFNVFGNLEVVTVTEDYAKLNPVWAVYANETLPNYPLDQLRAISPPSELRSPPLNHRNEIRFTEVNVSLLHEAWINGKAEISWCSIHELSETCNPFVKEFAVAMIKIKRRDTNEWKKVTTYLRALAGDGYGTILAPGRPMEFVIFEKDPCINNNVKNYTTACGNLVQFCSEQNSYGEGYAWYTPAPPPPAMWIAQPNLVMTGITLKSERLSH
jgi:hypothetical protein